MAFGRRLSCLLGVLVSAYGIFVEFKMEEAEHAKVKWKKAQSSSKVAYGAASLAPEPKAYEVRCAAASFGCL